MAPLVQQEDLQQGPRTLAERLQDYIASCDRVIVLIGTAYGTEAGITGEPSDSKLRSYTQWEYYFAMGERLDGTRAAPKDCGCTPG